MTKEERNQLFQQHGVTKEQVKEMFHQLQDENYFANGIYFANYRFKELDQFNLEEVIRKLKDHLRYIEYCQSTNNEILQDELDTSNYDDFEKEIYYKMINGQSHRISESDLQRLVDEYSFKDIEGSDGRWTRSMRSICDLKGILVAVNWEKGLTEYQENSYSRINFVKAEEKTIVVTDYITCDAPHFVDELDKETDEEVEEELDNDFDLD